VTSLAVQEFNQKKQVSRIGQQGKTEIVWK